MIDVLYIARSHSEIMNQVKKELQIIQEDKKRKEKFFIDFYEKAFLDGVDFSINFILDIIKKGNY